MTSWTQTEAAAPELAAAVHAALSRATSALMATLRRDGSPRLSGIDPVFGLGELWLGMTTGSRKAADLQRDPRLALHNAVLDPGTTDGDVKLAGAAVAIDDPATFDAVRDLTAARAAGDAPEPPESYHLFRVDVTGLARIRVEGNLLVVDSWRPGVPVTRVTRQ